MGLLGSPLLTLAQTGGQFDLSWSTIDAGGGTSGGGQFSVSGTYGQPDAGVLAGGDFVLQGGFWCGVSLVQTAGAPTLKIKLTPNGLAVLSWPLGVSGFSLQENPNLSNPMWIATPQAVVDTATEHTVTVPAGGLIKFFRLKK